MEWFWTWLRQPGTLRAINVVLAFIGATISPEMMDQIIMAMMAIWALIDGFYNQQPRKPE